MPETQTCASCKWWKTGEGQTGWGICSYNPPTPIAVRTGGNVATNMSIEAIGVRPSTKGDEYCHGYECCLVEK